MVYQSRKLPYSIESRKTALNKAFSKKNNPGPNGNILTAPTTTRLDAAKAAYSAGFLALTIARGNLHAATPTKLAAFLEAQMYCRHFIMVFNMGVARGLFTASQRAYFGIEVTDDTAPDVKSETALLEKCEEIITGNVARLSAGGEPMGFPTIDEVQEKYDTFRDLYETYSNLKDELDNKQEDMEAQITEVDNVIKKVWDEVETFYNEEEPASKRANAQEWGVVYISVGATKTITIQLAMADGSDVPAALEVLLQDEAQISNAEAQAIYNTDLQGELTVQVNGPEIVPYNGLINVLPDGNQTFEILLERVE